jgi:hypothetical protein
MECKVKNINHVRMPMEASIGSNTPMSLADIVSKIIEEGTQVKRIVVLLNFVMGQF